LRSFFKASPISVKNRKGGTAPAHVWILHAQTELRCEGLNPLEPMHRRRFAPRHGGDIERGQRFLRKRWFMADGTEFTTRHCRACGDAIERSLELEEDGGR
jgi:hypothetical protein